MKIKQSQNEMVVLWGAGAPFAIALGCIIIGVGAATTVYLLHSAELFGLISVGVSLAVMGAIILGFLKNKKTILSKGGTSTYSEERIIGGKQTSTSFQTDQVASVRLFISSGIGEASHTLQSTLLLVMRDTSTLQIGFESKNVSTSTFNSTPANLPKALLYNESARIAEFLGVPLETPM